MYRNISERVKLNSGVKRDATINRNVQKWVKLKLKCREIECNNLQKVQKHMRNSPYLYYRYLISTMCGIHNIIQN